MVFKKILFILILPFFLYAQWTDPRPKSIQLWHLNTSFFDSLGNVVRDSLSNISADSTTIANVSGSFKQVVFADTAALTATTGLEAGGRFIVKQLSSSNENGGGVFVKIPKGYAVPIISGVSFVNADGDTIVREQILRKETPVEATWFGVKADGSTNNATALSNAESAARTLARSLELPTGIILTESTWHVYNTSQYNGIRIRGQGENRTIIKGDGSGYAIVKIGNGIATRTNNVVLQDLSIHSTGIDVSADTLLYFDVIGNLTIDRVELGGNGLGGALGLYAYRLDKMLFNQTNFTRNLKNAVIETNVNGVQFNSCNFNAIGGEDSVSVEFRSCSGIVFIGGEGGNGGVLFKFSNIGKVAFYGGNYETATDTAFIVLEGGDGGSEVILDGNVRFLGGGGGNDLLAVVGGGSNLILENCDFSQLRASYQIILSSGDVYNNKYETNAYVYIPSNGEIYRAQKYDVLFDNSALPSASNTTRGKATFWWGRDDAQTLSDRLFITQKILNSGGDSTFYSNNILYGNDKRWASNGNHGGANSGVIDPMIEYYGYHDFITFSGDSTLDTIYTDASDGTGNLYYFNANLFLNGNIGIDEWTVNLFKYTPATGQAIFVIWHKNDTGGSISSRYNYMLRVQGKPENY